VGRDAVFDRPPLGAPWRQKNSTCPKTYARLKPKPIKNPPQSPPTSAQFLKFWFLQGAPTPERGDWVISHVLRAISAPYDFYIQRNEPSNMAACNVVEKRDWKKLSQKMHFPLESLLLIESSWIYAQWYRAIIAAKYHRFLKWKFWQLLKIIIKFLSFDPKFPDRKPEPEVVFAAILAKNRVSRFF